MKAAIISFSGASGNLELAEALETQTNFTVHMVDDQTTDLSEFDLIFLPGGSSYGDSLRPGAIAAQTPVAEALKNTRENQKIIGIGNGFQILCEMRLLPGGFLLNKSLNFHEEFVAINFEQEELVLPVSAKFGQFVLFEELSTEQIVMRYKNGSPFGKDATDVAAVKNEDGRVLGIFAHPERACQSWQQSPDGAQFFHWLETEFARKEGDR